MSMSLRQTILKNSRGLPPMGSSSRPRNQPPGRVLTPLEWSEFFDEKRSLEIDGDSFNIYTKGSSGPIFFLLHGGGYSGLTWACFAMDLSSRIDCRIVAPDLRGHGDTRTTDDYSLSKEQQMSDVAAIFKAFYGEESAAVCVIGHSMGGALAVHTVHADLIPHVVGLIVVDVVEGTAMEALGHMQSFLHNRPTSFSSEEAAIKWCLQSGTARNQKAARISMPSQIVKADDEKLHWRLDLARSAGYWPGWFEGLSQSFLHSTPPKLLVLADVDRLDKDLMIGQMQGKFQTAVLPRVGHAVQEDSPEHLADEVARFATHFRFAELKEGVSSIEPRQALKLGQML